jgi:hypothetical protein
VVEEEGQELKAAVPAHPEQQNQREEVVRPQTWWEPLEALEVSKIPQESVVEDSVAQDLVVEMAADMVQQ